MTRNITQFKKAGSKDAQTEATFRPNILLYAPHRVSAPFNHIARVLPGMNEIRFSNHAELIGPSEMNSWHKANSVVRDIAPQDAVFFDISSSKKTYDGASMAENKLGTAFGGERDMQFVANAIMIVQRLQNIANEHGAKEPAIFLFDYGDEHEGIAADISYHTGAPVYMLNSEPTKIKLSHDVVVSDRYEYPAIELHQLESLDELKKIATVHYKAPALEAQTQKVAALAL
ncbi:MAG: hypothetical protein CMH26_05535 [Micavibrio sp.]|nr:hypothetical protein [Micavibrio sp.]